MGGGTVQISKTKKQAGIDFKPRLVRKPKEISYGLKKNLPRGYYNSKHLHAKHMET